MNLNIETKAFVDELAKAGGEPLYTLTPGDARKVLNDLQEKTHKEIEADVYDTTVANVSVRFIRPKKNSEKLPVIFYLHGGGWILGNKETHDELVRKLAVHTNSVVVFPSYDPSPEAVYPRAIDQAYSVLDFICNNSDEYNIDEKRIVLAGDSVGGNMATVLALKAKKENGPKILFQALFYPVTDANMDTQSYKEFENGPWLTKKAMEWFWNAYLPDKSRKDEIYVSPLKASLDDLKGLPPTLIITDENDVLRDEGEAYAKRLDEAGVDVANVRMNGTIHDFMMLNALSNTAPAKAAIALACKMIKKSFLDYSV